jgi:hypothetical protein
MLQSFAKSCCKFLIVGALFVGPVRSSVVLDFEGLADGTPVDSTYASQGAIFTNATAISAGLSLNELDFPPHSGQNVAIDSGGPITISFSSPIDYFSAYFTYVTPLQLIALDSSNNQVDVSSSLFAENPVFSGNPPNEFIQLSYSAGFDSVTITGDPAGNSFVMDDVTFEAGTQVVGAVPEPSALPSCIGLLVGFSAWPLTRIRRK